MGGLVLSWMVFAPDGKYSVGANDYHMRKFRTNTAAAYSNHVKEKSLWIEKTVADWVVNTPDLTDPEKVYHIDKAITLPNTSGLAGLDGLKYLESIMLSNNGVPSGGSGSAGSGSSTINNTINSIKQKQKVVMEKINEYLRNIDVKQIALVAVVVTVGYYLYKKFIK